MVQQYKILNVREGDYHRLRCLFVSVIPYNEKTQNLPADPKNEYTYKNEMFMIVLPFSHEMDKHLKLTGHSTTPFILEDRDYLERKLNTEIQEIIDNRIIRIPIKSALVHCELSHEARKKASLVKRMLNIITKEI